MKSLLKSVLTIIATTTIATVAMTATVSAISSNLSTRSGLTNTSGLWTGTFYTSNVATYSNTFADPVTFQQTARGATSRVAAESNYTGNFKRTSIILRNTNNATTYANSPDSVANNATVSITASYNGTLSTGDYYGYMYDGSGAGSSYLERCLVHVIKS